MKRCEVWFEIQYRMKPTERWGSWRNRRFSAMERPWAYKTKASAQRCVHHLVHGGLGWKAEQFRIIRMTFEVVFEGGGR